MCTHRDFLGLSDQQLLKQCEVDTYKASGPGGQHRNKVSSAVRLRHKPTGLSAHGDQSRSQHDNKRLAVRRLRATIACQMRAPIDPGGTPPPELAECIHVRKGGQATGRKHIQIGRKDHRFWPVTARVLDVVETFEARLSDAAGWLGITTSNLISLLKQDPQLFTAAQKLRDKHGQKPIR